MMNPDYIASALLLINEHKEPDEGSTSGSRLKAEVQILEPHAWVLPARLPPMSRLLKDAKQTAIESRRQAILDASMAQALQEELDKPTSPVFERSRSNSNDMNTLNSSKGSTRSSEGSVKSRPRLPNFGGSSKGKGQVKKRSWEAHDVYRAIEKKDLMTLFEIRDAAFHLLVQKTGTQTPVLYASRIGKSHREIAILLTGALSRFVNQLPDDSSVLEPSTLSLIRAVRANLKLAINESLSSSQTELISSYLQIIIMSEGEKWVKEQTNNVALAIKQGAREGMPVRTARNAVRNFATRELRSLEKGAAVASVEDYLANATNDLIMMALWSLVTDKIGGGLLPSYQFGRDDRIFKTFSDSIHSVSNAQQYEYTKKVTRHLRGQIDATITIMDARATGHAEKSRELAEVFDTPR